MPVRSAASRIRVTAILAVTMATGLVSACSSGASSSDLNATSTPFSAGSTSPDTAPVGTAAITAPSPGAILSSDRVFNFVAPSGWNVTPNAQAILDLSSATVSHSVAPTFVVTKSKQTPAPALSDVLQMSLMQARQEGSSVQRLPDRTVGGESAVGFTAQSLQNSVDVTQTYYLVAHDRALYIIVSTAATRDAASVQNTANSVLASWSWTKAGDKDSTATGTTPAAIPTTTSTSAAPTSTAPTSSGATTSSSGAPSSSTPSSSIPVPSGTHSASPKNTKR